MSLDIPNQEVGDQKLIETIELVIKNIRKGVYEELDKEFILSFLTQYTTGKQIKLDPEILKYLFTGWFLHENSEL